MKPNIKAITALSGTFFIFFLALTPLGSFDDWVPKIWQTGYYSITQIDAGDDAGYYAYLRSVFFDNDLDFINEKKYAHIERFTSTGYVFNNWQIGQSILFLPFFLLGHLSAIILNNFGFSFLLDGYSLPYSMATAIAAQTYLFLGLLFLYKALTKYFSQTPALAATLGIWLGSPLIYYSFIRQRMAHTTEFFMATVFIFFWLKFRESKKHINHAFLGTLLGLFCMVRIINISFFALYFFDQIFHQASLLSKNNKQFLKTFFYRSFWMLFLFFIVLLPQLFIWQKLNGTFLPTRHLGMASAGLNFISIKELLRNIFGIFFSQQWGLFLSFPLFIISVLGFFSDNQLKQIRLSVFIYLVALILIIAIYPESSASYGERHFISSIPLLAIGLAAIINKIKTSPSIFKGGIALIASFAALQYFILVQYRILLPYNDPQFTLKALMGIPSLILENNEFLSRSTNFFKLIFYANPQILNKESFLFLILFPGIQLAAIILSGFFFTKCNAYFKEKKNFIKTTLNLILFLTLICFIYLYKITPSKTYGQIKSRFVYKEAVDKGDIKAKNGDLKQAIDLFKNASKILPEHWGAYLRMGFAYEAQSDYKTSNNYYKKVLKLNPYNIESYRKLGENSFRLGLFEKAETYLKKSIALNPRDKKSFHYLAIIFAEQKRVQDAIKMFKISLALDPNYKNAHLNFAKLLSLLEQNQTAILHLKEAVRLGVKKDKIQKLALQLQLPLNN
jgi:tetratricopeptide (TPR) repeat protein